MKMLFLEDEVNARWGLVALLTARGHTVDEVERVDDALQLLHERRYDALIIDVMLRDRSSRSPLDLFVPRELGYQLVLHLRKGTLGELATDKEVPVVAITAVAVREVLSELKALPRTLVLSKPVDPAEVLLEIEKFLEQCKRDGEHD